MKERHLESLPSKLRGVIGRYPDEDEVYVFNFDSVNDRLIHMIGVRRPLLVTWYEGGEQVARETLRPWEGYANHPADRVTEQRP